MNPDVSLEFWAEAVALLERLHGARVTDYRDLYMLQQWAACLERGWAGPVEHFSAPFGRGSLLQAWSSLPAAVALAWADRVLAGDPGEA